MSIHWCPCSGWGAAYPGKSFPTCSSLADRKQLRQFSHLATSTIMFHFVITFPPFVDVGVRRRRLCRGHGYPRVDLLGCGGQCFAPPLDLDETRIGRHAACPRALRPAGGEKVDATTAVGRLARQTERLVVRRRLVGVGYPLAQSVRDLGSADDLPAIVEQAHEITVLDGAPLGVGRTDADDEIIMPIDQPAVFGDVVDRRV